MVNTFFDIETAKNMLPELQELLRTRPDVKTLANLAACYYTLGQPEKAYPYAKKAFEMVPNGQLGVNFGIILKNLGLHDQSLLSVQEAYLYSPDDYYARMAYGEGLLRAGLWKQAWPYYDNARPTQQGAAAHVGLPHEVKEWNGEPLPEGHNLLVINEGGMGDRFNYARWLPVLTNMGINWKFYPYDDTYSFYERIFPKEKLIHDGEEMEPSPTHWTTPFSIPAKLGVTPLEIPQPLRYTALPEKIEKFIDS